MSDVSYSWTMKKKRRKTKTSCCSLKNLKMTSLKNTGCDVLKKWGEHLIVCKNNWFICRSDPCLETHGLVDIPWSNLISKTAPEIDVRFSTYFCNCMEKLTRLTLDTKSVSFSIVFYHIYIYILYMWNIFRPAFGAVYDLRGDQFIDAIDKENKNVTVIIHVYEEVNMIYDIFMIA